MSLGHKRLETDRSWEREKDVSHVHGSPVPPLLDLCLYVVCKHIDGCKYLNVLPDHVRQRLCLLFRQETLFQERIDHLNLSYCHQLNDEELKSIAHLKKLTKLNVSHCDKLTGIGMSYIGTLTNLKTLCLNHCTKVSLGFYFLQPLSHLTRLEVSFCEIQDPVMPFITSKTSLTYLNLMCNRLTDEGCASLQQLKNLTHLSLSMNPLITDKTLYCLTGLTNLTSLNINFCKLLTSEAIKKLSKDLDPTLKQIDMIGCDRALNEGLYYLLFF
jgi:Leucine-rich repeat (LRR) protein